MFSAIKPLSLNSIVTLVVSKLFNLVSDRLSDLIIPNSDQDQLLFTCLLLFLINIIFYYLTKEFKNNHNIFLNIWRSIGNKIDKIAADIFADSFPCLAWVID